MRSAIPYAHAAGTPAPPPPSILTFRFRTTIGEALEALEDAGGLRAPHAHDLSHADAAAAFRSHLESRELFEVEAQFPNGSSQDLPCYLEPPYSGYQKWMYTHPDEKPQPSVGVSEKLGIASERERANIYYFDARRTDFSECDDSGVTKIDFTGGNLASALAQRQANPEWHREYMSLVKRVLPDLEWVSAKTTRGRAQLWSSLERLTIGGDEQQIPLSDCGAGVGHVLALVYIAFYEKNRTLLIDEPQAYLHPSACRALIRVFQDLKDHGHRFVIATHSTAMLSEAMPANVIEVHREDRRSVFRPTSATTMREACALLPLVGARWSDVFGPDRLVWVEGETEAACYPILLRATSSQHATTFVPLRATGDFSGKKTSKAKHAYDIYRKVTANLSLAAQHCLILLDREGLSDEEMNDKAHRIPDGVLHFAPDRMFENLLLDANALTTRLVELLAQNSLPADHAFIRAQIDAKLAAPAPSDSAAKLLKEIYETVSESRLEYRKVDEGVALTKLILQNNPKHFDPLIKWLLGKLELR